ncbi:MAG: MFS transporter [Alicyclobacillus sp.]|nr:MFS transporter [Alicyclobacillus sp.]
MTSMEETARIRTRLSRWVEPELFQPFVFGVLLSITCSEFVRGALIYSLLPTYGRTVLGFAVEWTGLAISLHYIVDNALRVPIGWLTDRLGQRKMLLTGFAFAVASVFLMSRVHTVAGLLAAAGLYGLGVTPMWPCAMAAIGVATPQEKRASFMGYLYIFWLVGVGLGSVVINFLIDRTYQTAFWVLIAVDAAGFAQAWWLVRRPQTMRQRPQSRLARARYWRGLWRNVREVAFLFPGMFAQTFAVASLVPILSLYARVVLRVSPAVYSTIMVAGGLCAVALLLPAGRLVDRFGPRRFLVPAFFIAGTGLAVYPFYHGLVFTYAFVVVLGLCYAFILPAWNTVLDHGIDPDKKGTLWGVFQTVDGLGSAAGPYLGGLLWDAVSPSAPFWLSAGVILTMGLVYMMLPIESVHHRAAARRRRLAAH